MDDPELRYRLDALPNAVFRSKAGDRRTVGLTTPTAIHLSRKSRRIAEIVAFQLSHGRRDAFTGNL